MRRNLSITHLRKIAKIRELQRIDTEVRAVRATAHVAEKVAVERLAIESRDVAEGHWKSLHEEKTMPLELVRLWVGKLQQENALVEAAEGDVKDARSAKEWMIKNYQAAEQRQTLAEDARNMALCENARLQDEAALQDASDRHLQSKARQ